jgi:hypothetical protein
MEAYRTTTVVKPHGVVTLEGVPLPDGVNVEVVVTPRVTNTAVAQYPLRGTPVSYREPTEPVCLEDWESTE